MRCPPPVPTRIHKKSIGTKTGAVCHAVARSSVERALRCVRIMHLACCVGESVCAASHLLYVFPCRVAAGNATPAVRTPKKKTRNAFACHALQRDVSGATTNQSDRRFLNWWSNRCVTLSGPFGAFGILYSFTEATGITGLF